MWRNVFFGGNVGYRARSGRGKKRRLAATGAPLTAITVSAITGVPAASADSSETVIVTASGLHAPSDAFLTQTGASQLAAQGDTGQGVTVAVLDTGIDQLPDFAGWLIGGVDLTGTGAAWGPYWDTKSWNGG